MFEKKIYDIDNESSISVIIKNIKRNNNNYKDQKAIFIITDDEFGFGLKTMTILSKENTMKLIELLQEKIKELK